jgi:hypothetical protein
MIPTLKWLDRKYRAQEKEKAAEREPGNGFGSESEFTDSAMT